jgi:hypothetical protein
MGSNDATARPDFQKHIADALSIPGVSKKKISEWAGVDPSTVTRWCQGARPSDPLEILKLLAPHLERTRESLASFERRQVESWAALTAEASPDVQAYAKETGLLASRNYAIASRIPTAPHPRECDVVFLRYFEGVWADMSRRIYNVGDLSQIVNLGDDTEAPGFDQARALGDIVRLEINRDKEIGKSIARFHAKLDLESFPYRNDSIGFIGKFGYGYRAMRAIVKQAYYAEQTNDYLGTTIPVPCKRYNLLVCIPRSCRIGPPSGLALSNRSMLKTLLELDKAEPDKVESFLWPRGRRYEMGAGPDSPLTEPRIQNFIESLPAPLQEWLEQPGDLDSYGPCIREVLTSSNSVCYLLDLHSPHPSLTAMIVWRLPPRQS